MASSSASPVNTTGDPAQQYDEPVPEQQQTTATPSIQENTPPTKTDPPAPQSSATPQPPNQTIDEDDDESDFDELDEVLDDFKPKPQTDIPTKSPALPTPPISSTGAAVATEDLDEIAFMNQLEKDMANMMSQAAQQSGVSDNGSFESAINQGADAFTKQLEESGIPPGDFLKQLLADVMAEEGLGGDGDGLSARESSVAPGSTSSATAAAAATAPSPPPPPPPESFNDAIQRTINRMKESGDKATAAAEEDGDNADDLVAQLLKAIEAGADGAGDEGDLSKMFMGMMEQLSNKDMLYEPMKELDTKFAPWIKENKGKGKFSDEDMARYENQATLVSRIVAKFEDPSYTDDDPKSREYVWEMMQEMQAAGNPPDELVANPWMDDSKGGVPDCPQQ